MFTSTVERLQDIKNKKLILLCVLVVLAFISIFNGIFEPFAQKKQGVADTVRVYAGKLPSETEWVQRTMERTAHKDWKRNPFLPIDFAPREVGELVLNGIAWDPKTPKAIINDDIYEVGQEVSGRVVKKIQIDRVILSGQFKDTVLTLGETPAE